MFLATTADAKFWKPGEPLLFLGKWCTLYSQRNHWENRPHEILPYHWDETGRWHRDYARLTGVYEHALTHLAEALNRLHRVSFSTRYWRILIGPWLFYFIDVLYDRYRCLETAAESGRVTATWIAENSPGIWCPNDYPEFIEFYFTDAYNFHLYSALIPEFGNIPYETRPGPDPITIPHRPKPSGVYHQIRSLLKNTLQTFSRSIPDSKNSVVFVSSYFPPRDLIRLQRALGQWPYVLAPTVAPGSYGWQAERRAGLQSGWSRDPFERALETLVAEQIPRVYIEGYTDMRQRSLAAFPRCPRAAVTSDGLYFNDGFRFWAAEQTERGMKLMSVQHGGHFGVSAQSRPEDFEISVADRYITWGWDRPEHTNIQPLPAPKLASIAQQLSPKTEGGLLMVEGSLPRYSYNLYGVPNGPQFENYLAEQQRFALALCEAARGLLTVRLYPQDFGWNEPHRWRDFKPPVKLDTGRQPLNNRLCQSRLFVGTYNGTTFLETLAGNFPTVLFWNPEQWEIRPEARPYFDRLEKVGIFHTTPESAATHVNTIFEDPQAWWQTPQVQESKNHFCDRFARTSPNWLEEWRTELFKIIEGQE